MVADHQRSRAAEFESKYPLTIGKTYLVLGMSIWENVFEFLVRDDWGGPCFAPAGFFDLFTAPVPQGWMFGLRQGIRSSGQDLWSSPGVAVWGYPELVGDPDHAAALQEQEPDALALFDRYYAAAEESGAS
ncbi:hypothetical protein [Mumia zhuanghuii]|uniref:Uncharacterized protein n=1 Tax=Mumia zhuanghuii TaxID=2585211 RepID=A0A5C4MD56_9ACTN|nr:hypothetical protein [Mumia zhuanghuii]TNC31267.1 hypothetical protein FHE65_31830 [Mumia zhuanghuii]